MFNKKEYMKNYYQKHKKEHSENCKKYRMNHANILLDLKINGCGICGYNKYNGALEFHHTNPEDKKFTISYSNMYFKDERIIDELNKCILLCSNCHREIEKVK